MLMQVLLDYSRSAARNHSCRYVLREATPASVEPGREVDIQAVATRTGSLRTLAGSDINLQPSSPQSLVMSSFDSKSGSWTNEL